MPKSSIKVSGIHCKWVAGEDLEGPPNGLTKKKIQRIIEEWQERLELTEWSITFDHKRPPAGDSSFADVWVSGDYHYAIIRLRNWKTTNPFWIQQRIVHELMHLRLKPIDRIFDPALEHLAFALKEHMSEQMYSAREGIVEKLANTYLDGFGLVEV